MTKLILIACALATTMVSASTIGISTHPFEAKKRAITAEFNTYLSNGSGTGVTVGYFQKINSEMNFDAGIGLADGDRSSRIFAGLDYQIFPDYGRQPRVSVKGLFETMSFASDRVNSIGAAPTVSKGFLMWGQEAFPFVSLPTKLSLNSNRNTYETQIAMATGITSRFRVDDRELIGNLEMNIDLRNSFSSFVLGVTLPL